MHYRGLLRVVGRDRGIRIYSAHDHARAPSDGASLASRIDTLVDIVVRAYAPLPRTSLSALVRQLRFAVPQWRRRLGAALDRALGRLTHARIDAVDWHWPAGESPADYEMPSAVRLLAPFDPVVADRRRFELFWRWTYRFEAYTPAKKRKLGYYALPLLWQDRVIGWANASVEGGRLQTQFGYVGSPPRSRAYARELEAELERVRGFLRIDAVETR